MVGTHTTNAIDSFSEQAISQSVFNDGLTADRWKRSTEALWLRLHHFHPGGDPCAKSGKYVRPVVSEPEPPSSPPPPPPVEVDRRDLSVEKADELAEHIIRHQVHKIQDAAAKHFKVSRIEMLASRRTASIVRARHVAMYVSKTETLRSLPEIGRRFGGRDHTSVLHAVRKVEANLSLYQGDIDAIKALLA